MKFGTFEIRPLFLLLVFMPVSFILFFAQANSVLIFFASCLAIIPLAGIIGDATEHLAERTGPGIGGLLNATFGNATELIIALIAIKNGLHDVVKASLTGSIIGNILLVIGVSIVAGGIKRPRQTFERTSASLGASLMALSAIGLLIPAVFDFVVGQSGQIRERELSLNIAFVLAAIYVLNLIFMLRTHKYLYSRRVKETETSSVKIEQASHFWSIKKSIVVLCITIAFVAIISEFLVATVEEATHVLGMTDVFIGVIVVAIIGNAAEHSSAVSMAVKNNMDLAMNIAVGSSIQISLFVAPMLVFCSYFIGNPMDLLFTPFEVIAVAVSVWLFNIIAQDGETHWMEGALCLGLYCIIGMAFYYLP